MSTKDAKQKVSAQVADVEFTTSRRQREWIADLMNMDQATSLSLTLAGKLSNLILRTNFHMLCTIFTCGKIIIICQSSVNYYTNSNSWFGCKTSLFIFRMPALSGNSLRCVLTVFTGLGHRHLHKFLLEGNTLPCAAQGMLPKFRGLLFNP